LSTVKMSYMIMAAQQGRPLYFAPVVSVFLLFSLPILSCCRLDVYHTSTHDVALVQIWNAGLKSAARGLLIIRDAKSRHLYTITQLFWAISLELKARIDTHAVCVSQTLQQGTKKGITELSRLVCATYIWQCSHHVEHRATHSSSFFLAYSQLSQIRCTILLHMNWP